MKRILIATGIYPPDIGGPATHAKLLADGLGARVVTYTPFLRKIPTPLRQVIFFFKTWYASRKSDLIYALSPLGTGVASALTGKSFFVRVAGDRAWEDAVVQGRTTLLIDDFQKIKNRGFKHRMQVWVCKKARAIVVPSRYLATIVGGWGIAQEKIHVIPNAVLSPPETANVPDIGIRGTILFSMGRLVPWKGFRMLIKIMPELLRINGFFRLVIAGDGPDRKTLEVMIKNLHLENKVYLLGKQSPSQVWHYLRASHIFLLNTGYEGFSHQLLEAMTAGAPMITTNVGGNRELIRQGENGFMVKYNDEFNLIEAVKTLSASAELREKFIAEGRVTANSYTIDRMIEATREVLTIERR